MEAYSWLDKVRTRIFENIALIATILGMCVVFVIASLEGTKEIKATGSVNAKLLQMWRAENVELYPKEKEDIIVYKGKEYYFVIDKIDEETKEIIKWHFAYDGGFEYVFRDAKFWILTILVWVVAEIITQVNTTAAIKKAKDTEEFKRTLKYYQDEKEKIKKYTQYLPDYCAYKIKQEYEAKCKEIVMSAGLNYDLFKDNKIDNNKLEKWQKRRLMKMKDIRIDFDYNDLLYEKGKVDTHISLLPPSEEDYKRTGVYKRLVTRLFANILSGATISFGFIIGNWQLGITYTFVILSSAVMAYIKGYDFGLTVLRNRFIAKAEHFNEFYNIKEIFVEKEDEHNGLPEQQKT